MRRILVLVHIFNFVVCLANWKSRQIDVQGPEWKMRFSIKKKKFVARFRPLPHYASPKKFENAPLFLLLGLPSTLIRHESGAFQNQSDLNSNRRNLKSLALCFSVYGNILKTELFENEWHCGNHDILLSKISSNANAKWPLIIGLSDFSGVVWMEITFDVFVFGGKTPFWNCSCEVWMGS